MHVEDLPHIPIGVSNPPSIMLHLQTLLERPSKASKPYPHMPTVNDMSRDVVQVRFTFVDLKTIVINCNFTANCVAHEWN